MSTCQFVTSNASASSFLGTDTHKLIDPIYVDFRVDGVLYRLHLEKEWATDGLSIPRIFQWYLPSWEKENIVYNLAGAVHDSGYCCKGWNIFSREQMDDIFRGIIRDSGITRRKAGLADKCLEWFAKSHWGDDSLGVREKISLARI